MSGVARLLDQFVPAHYALHISLEHKPHIFRGSITITGRLPKPSSKVKLHSAGLSIKQARINQQFAAMSQEDDELTLHVPDTLHDEVTIELEFGGDVTDSLHGFYPGRYEHNGEPKELFLTQFESHHAREAFPCIDEPAAKATFDLTITTDKSFTVLANTPQKKRKVTGQTQTISFETTPRMSTYLLAWVIGDLHHIEANAQDDTLVRVWATKAQALSELEFALTTAVKNIDFFNDYFHTPYPLPKLDHVAIPDFSAGAMENWGLITYREVALLVNPTTPVDARQFVAICIAHETAHQWFGNLVTMQWWDDLWLNESFANMMEYVATDAIYPELTIWKLFLTREAASALKRDALPGVQSVRTPVTHPNEISSIFDPSIVYAKGSRVLNMIRSHTGDKAFQKGLRLYFRRHAYKNTTGDDLWAALSDGSGIDVAAIVTPWLTRPHYPVLVVEHHKNHVRLTQEQFVLGESDPSIIWPLPLDASSAQAPHLLETKTLSFPSKRPVWFNHHSTTHSLTHYDHDQRQLLLSETLAGQRDEITRITYLMDASLLARSNFLETSEHFATLAAYKNETSDHAWLLMAGLIGQLKVFVEPSSPEETSLRHFVHQLAKPPYDRLGLLPQPNDTDATLRLRSTIISCMLYGRDQEVIDSLLTLHREHKTHSLGGDTRETIYTAVALFGTDKERRELLNSYPRATPNGIVELSRSLSCAKDPRFVTLLISKLLDPQFVRLHDLPRWFAGLIGNRYTQHQAWQWLTTNWNEIVTRMDGDIHYDDFARYSAMAITTPELAKAYHQFFADKKSDPALTRAIAMGEQEITQRLEWISHDKRDVLAKLKAYSQKHLEDA